MSDALDKQRDNLENELDELRDELLVADANYENATTIAERDAADVECKRLRSELHARQQQLRTLKEDFRNSSAPVASDEPLNKRAQAAGE
jgi:uncharacterized protein (DUF3084 family)